jgi:short-subunit dehydrogenase
MDPNTRPTALVTGASSGLGETFARKLAARGYDLILVARRADRLARLAEELMAQHVGLRAQSIGVDLATDAGVAEVEEAIRQCPNLDLLVNNAGFGTLRHFWEADIAGQRDMHMLHVLATVRLSHAALGPMVRRGRGGIINVSSVAAFSINPGNVSYCSTKAWMNSFTEGLDIELRHAKSAVKVQALCPGFTYTEFHDTLGVDRKNIPAWLWLSADDVVEQSLKGLDKGEVLVVPGLAYKLVAALVRPLPYSIRKHLKRPFKDERA